MPYQEKNIGEGVYAADENNLRSASRGTFVRSGGTVTVGASTSGVVLNIDATAIRVDGNDYSAASGSVTLSGNSTAYPRRDLVFAVKGPTTSDPASYDFATGQTIDDATMETLVNEGVIDSNGQPIHEPEDIPEIQPPAFQGERTNATLLAMVYVPPGTADSTDLSGSLITDMRMEGIGVGDVLRSGDAVAEVENHSDALAIDISGAAGTAGEFAGRDLTQFRRANGMLITTTADGSQNAPRIHIPSDTSLRVWRAGVLDDNLAAPDNTIASVYNSTDSDRIYTANGVKSEDTSFSAAGAFDAQFICEDNSGGAAVNPTAHFVITLEPDSF